MHPPLCPGLAQNRYLGDPAFLCFLAYLQYWRRPEYAVFVTYPNCLQFLELLQNPGFRTAIANPNYKVRHLPVLIVCCSGQREVIGRAVGG